MTDTIQKESRDYSSFLIDKKKYNEEKIQPEVTKRDKKNEMAAAANSTSVIKSRNCAKKRESRLSFFDCFSSLVPYRARRSLACFPVRPSAVLFRCCSVMSEEREWKYILCSSWEIIVKALK